MLDTSQLDFTTLTLDFVEPSILLVTLNRPEVRNAINSVMMSELLKLWRAIAPITELRCIILTGAQNAFCAGADLKERKDISIAVWKSQHAVLIESMKAMLQCPIPIIAAVNGAAFGGGLELVLASDFAYAADTAIFSQSEVKIGLIPGAFGTQHLPRVVGLQRAKELVFTGTRFSAKEALAWGIINKVCEPSQLLEEVGNVAKLIRDNAPVAIRLAKKALNASRELLIEAGFDCELQSYYQALDTEDRIKGINAFNQKILPQFSGK